MNLGGLRIEKRLKQRRWLMVAVPLGSLIVAHIAIALLLMATGHPPITTLRRLFDAAYLANGALTNTLIAYAAASVVVGYFVMSKIADVDL